MSELKAVHAFDVYEAYTKTGNDDAAQVYDKSEADKVIEELNEIAKDACLERDDNQNVIDELDVENRRLKRALWMSRAERAKWQSLYYWYAISDKYKRRKFDDVERKCRAKAEEYE